MSFEKSFYMCVRHTYLIFAYLFIGFENIIESDYNFIEFYEVRTFVDERTVLIFFSFQTGISFHDD